MPRNLPPLPLPDGSWPRRAFDPAAVEEIRAALRAYDDDHDVDEAIQRIIRAVQRRHGPGVDS